MQMRHGMTALVRLGYALLLSTFLVGCFSDSSNSSSTSTSPSSDDAALSALSAAPAALTPAFSAEVTSYSASVGSDVSSVQLEATPRDADASLSYNGSALTAGSPGVTVPLATGSNLIEVVVTAADGSTTLSYRIEIEREGQPAGPSPDDATLSALSVAPAVLSPAFSAEITSYSASVGDDVSSVQLVATPHDEDASLSYDGSALAAGIPGVAVPLATGSNLIEVTVTAADGSTTSIYSIEIERAEAPPVVETTMLQLMVLDTDGAPVVGAQATADGVPDSTSTNEEGRVVLRAPAIEGAVLRLSRSGFVDQLLRLDLSNGSSADAPLRVGMMRRAAAKRFAADQPVELTGADGARVELPAHAFVDASGNLVSGEIDAFITPLNITSDAGLAAFPGGFDARAPDGEMASMASFGVADFSFEQNGQHLQLAPGVTAIIDIPVYATEDVDGSVLQPNDPIPLWSLDETDSIWDHEGEGLLVAASASPSGLALRGTAHHFSGQGSGRVVFAQSGYLGERPSGLLPVLRCDEPHLSCATALPGQAGAWVGVPTMMRLYGPVQASSRWVPFADDGEIEPIPIVPRVDINVTTSISDGHYVLDSITPDPVRSEVGGETIEVTLLLKKRHLVDGGLFVPGERLRGRMTEIGEEHSYRFEGRAGRVFRLRGYPAASITSGPGISADLGATVRVWQGSTLLDEAFFDQNTVAEIDVPLPADGEYVVTITADDKVPNFYMVTTAMQRASGLAAGSVAFSAVSFVTGDYGLYAMDEDGETFVRLSPAVDSDRRSCLSPVYDPAPYTNCDTRERKISGGMGDPDMPGWRPRFIQQLPEGRIGYISDHDRPNFAELFMLDSQLVTRLSGEEIGGAEGFQVVDFRIAPDRPERIVYKVEPVQWQAPLRENEAGELYVVELTAPEQTRRAIPMADGLRSQRHELSRDGRWVVYQSLLPGSLVTGIDLHAVDLDAPASSPVRVNAPLDHEADERMYSFAISPDNRWVTYSALRRIDAETTRWRIYLVDLENPGVAIQISAADHRNAREARFSPDGRQLVYRNARSGRDHAALQGDGTLYVVDLSNPDQPGPPVVLLPTSYPDPTLTPRASTWQISPRGDQVIVEERSQLFGLPLDDPDAAPVLLLQLPADLRFSPLGWPVFTGDGDGVLMSTADLGMPGYNLPYGLVHQRFGDPPEGYRTLVGTEHFEFESRGVIQVALSASGTDAVVLIAARSSSGPDEIWSVALSGTEPPVLLVPHTDDTQQLQLTMGGYQHSYQFLPLDN